MPSVLTDSPPHKQESNKLSKKSMRKGSSPAAHIDFENDGEIVPNSPDAVGYSPRADLANRSQHAPSRRLPLRMDAQDGPWSVSVAPHDAKTYALYIKTATHHLTLMRSSSEIHSLHSKIRDSFPQLPLPPLPLEASDISPGTGKRRSSFLHTLSRFTSPGPKPRIMSSTAQSVSVQVSPNENKDDPIIATPTSVTTQLAAYLTTLSNDQIIRVSKPWRRFVRVRTDDLESVRVERAIKRVRSDLAMHAAVGSALGTPVNPTTSTANLAKESSTVNGASSGSQVQLREVNGNVESQSKDQLPEAPHIIQPTVITEPAPVLPPDRSLLEDENTAAAAAMATSTPAVSPLPSPVVLSEQLQPPVDRPISLPETPEPPSISPSPSPDKSAKQISHAVHRIQRSASADPDKSSRLSRLFQSSAPPSTDTEDESIGRKPKKQRSGESQPKKSMRKVVIDDFEMMRVLGKGCAGKVLLVRHKASGDTYALKAITKRHVLAHQELQHTLTEQAVLKRMARENADPFVVKLWWSFHDRENLFLVMDFHPGGDLATQLARWGRLGRDRARFYAAEIVEGVEGLHAAGVIYRDLKPENILIGVDGHIVLTDFGLSKEFPRAGDLDQDHVRPILPTAPATPSGTRVEYYSATEAVGSTSLSPSPYWMKTENSASPSRAAWQSDHRANDVTSTFCGTAEYLAPEVIQGLPYSYEVDWWSFGTMLFEMLTGITPFWANNHSDMYVRVLQDELQFPEDKSMDQDTRSLIRGLLQRNPVLRIKEPRLKKHPYFSMIDWSHVYHKRYIPPYIPPIEAGNPNDTQNFDDAFLDMDPILDNDPDPEPQTTDSERDKTDGDKTDGEDSVRTPAQSRSPSVHPIEDVAVDVFDGYSFKGRHSVVIDDDSTDTGYEVSEDEDEQAPEVPDATSGVELTVEDIAEEDEDEESAGAKTPEAKPAPLPAVLESEEQATEGLSVEENRVEAETAEETSQAVQELGSKPIDGDITADVETVPVHDDATETIQEAANQPIELPAIAQQTSETTATKLPRGRREKSGVPALDRQFLESLRDDAETKDEEDDWDFVEADVAEDRNGAKGTTLFARGVVDRYRLAVFRKSTTSRPKRLPRYFSGNSADHEGDNPERDASNLSPSPSEKIRRGRNPGISFKTPKQFLRARSPPATLSTSASAQSRTSLAKNSATVTPSTSMSKIGQSSSSLKSKPSFASVSAVVSPAASSQLPITGEFGVDSTADNRTSTSGEDQSGSKIKKMKKNYKEGAEKVLSLFGSPRS